MRMFMTTSSLMDQASISTRTLFPLPSAFWSSLIASVQAEPVRFLPYASRLPAPNRINC